MGHGFIRFQQTPWGSELRRCRTSSGREVSLLFIP